MQEKHVSAVQSPRRAKRGNSQSRSQNSRPTIGYLVSEIQRDFAMLPWLGMMDAARQHDVNLISLIGGILRPLSGFGEQANVLCDLAGVECLDGLIIWPGVMGAYLTQSEIEEFCQRYSSMPVVLLGEMSGDIPLVTTENYQGIRLVMDHLIEAHGYRRIAFAGMFESNAEFRTRYRAYTDALESHGLPVAAKLAKPWFPDEVIYPSGRIHEEAFAQWLKEAVEDGVEAMVGVADTIAFEITELLQAQGVRIPEDVAVVGYDDFRQSQVVTPPLTTANPSFYETGREAVEMLLAMMDGKPVPAQVTVPPQLMVRQSCGCLDPDVVLAAAGLVKPAAQVKRDGTAFNQREVVSEMVQAARCEAVEGIQWEVERLVESFMTQVNAEGADVFLNTLDGILRQATATGNDVTTWHNALSVLRQQTLPWLGEGNVAARAEDLWQQARVMIGKTAERAQAFQRLQAEQRANQLRDVSQTLITTFDMGNLLDVLAEELPRLGIPSCYLALYENPRPYRYPQPAPEWSRLILAYTEKGRIESEPDGRRFRSRELAPEELWPQERQFSLVAEPLYFQENQLGFVLFEAGPREGTLYETLRAQISSALHGAMLVQRVEHRSAQLQTATEVSRVISSFRDLDELLSQTVELLRDRFDLYYAGLFLVDQMGGRADVAGRQATLRAGTGEAGRQMLAAGHKLAVDGASMIGWCIAHQQARIAQDVGEEAIHFDNPLLPATRSELALPLISRGNAIGALTAQSDQPAAFSAEDIAVLQTIADQVANAIENTRLFTQAQAAIAEMEATQQRYVEQAWSSYVQSAVDLYHETTHSDMAPIGSALLPEMRQAIKQKHALTLGGNRQPLDIASAGDTHTALVAPVMLRDQVIGVLGVQDQDMTRQWSDEEVTLIQTVAERLAQVLENLRLFEDAQRRAARERTVGEVTSRIRETLDMETILRTAAEQMRQALDLEDLIVRLTPEQEAQPTAEGV